MPSAYSVPMASDVLPDPDTPTTATVRHSGTSTSMSCRLLCRAPRTPMTVGRVPGTEISPAAIPGNLRPSVSGRRRDGLRPAAVVRADMGGNLCAAIGSPRGLGRVKAHADIRDADRQQAERVPAVTSSSVGPAPGPAIAG